MALLAALQAINMPVDLLHFYRGAFAYGGPGDYSKETVSNLYYMLLDSDIRSLNHYFGEFIFEKNEADDPFLAGGIINTLRAEHTQYIKNIKDKSIDTISTDYILYGIEVDYADLKPRSGTDGEEYFAFVRMLFAGSDRLFGSDGDDILSGGAGGDRFEGGAGIDTVSYWDASERVTAHLNKRYKNKGDAAGDFYLSIANLSGSRFDDRLYGNAGPNTLNGVAGNDVLTGGLGADTLIGGQGADEFVFTRLEESTTGTKGRDTILDFSRKRGDTIDLTGIDAKAGSSKNDKFKFVAEAEFSGTKGELRIDVESKRTFIYGDVNGDAQADFAIELAKAIVLKATDFSL